MTDGLRIGDVARSAGVNVQTLRYYERRGLVVAAFRRHSGQREYDAADVKRVKVIKSAQRLGFSLAEIQEMLTCRPIDGRPANSARGQSRRSPRSTSGSPGCRLCVPTCPPSSRPSVTH